MNLSSWSSGENWSDLLWGVAEIAFGAGVIILGVWLGVKYVSKIYMAIKNWGRSK